MNNFVDKKKTNYKLYICGSQAAAYMTQYIYGYKIGQLSGYWISVRDRIISGEVSSKVQIINLISDRILVIILSQISDRPVLDIRSISFSIQALEAGEENVSVTNILGLGVLHTQPVFKYQAKGYRHADDVNIKLMLFSGLMIRDILTSWIRIQP